MLVLQAPDHLRRQGLQARTARAGRRTVGRIIACALPVGRKRRPRLPTLFCVEAQTQAVVRVGSGVSSYFRRLGLILHYFNSSKFATSHSFM